MRRHRLTAIAVLPVLLVGLAACGDDDGEAEDRPRAEGPTTLQPVDAGAPVADGLQRQTCELVTETRSLTLTLGVPVGAEPREDSEPGHSCGFYPQGDGIPEINVVLLHDDPESNDDADIAGLEDLEAGFEDRVGEEAVHDVEYERGVVVFGETVGDRLTWLGEYEGIPEWNFRAEADGVQVWLTAQGEEFDGAELEAVFQQISDSVGVG